MLKVVCPKCDNLVVLEQNSKKNQCSVCGAQLFSYFKNFPIKEEYEKHNEKELVSIGFILSKEHRFKRLSLVSGIILRDNPNNFWGNAFKLISEIEFDLITPAKTPSYMLNTNDMNIDVKARLYHAAREKYKNTGDKLLNKIKDFYPDEHPNKKTTKKMRTNYDINLDNVEYLYGRIGNFNKKYKFMSSLAKEEEEIKFVNNYKAYFDYLCFAKSQLDSYNLKANEFIQSDFDRTPRPGNKRLFIIYIFLGVLSLFTLSLSSAHIGLLLSGFSEYMSLFDAFASIGVAIIVLVMVILIIVKTPRLKNREHKTRIALVILTTIALDTAGIATIFSSTDSNRIGEWFFIFGLVSGISVFVYSVVSTLKNMPKKMNVNNTFIGDYKRLANNNLDIVYPYEWPKYKGTKMSSIKVK